MSVPRLSIKRCQCTASTCKTFQFNEGTFYEGCGFDEETAKRIAKIYNATAHLTDVELNNWIRSIHAKSIPRA